MSVERPDPFVAKRLRETAEAIRRDGEDAVWRRDVREHLRTLLEGAAAASIQFHWAVTEEPLPTLLSPCETEREEIGPLFANLFPSYTRDDHLSVVAAGPVQQLSAFARDSHVATCARKAGELDWCMLSALDTSGAGTFFAVVFERERVLSRGQRRILEWLTAHLTAQTRARSRKRVAARIAPGGKVLHAEGEATAVRNELRDLARCIEEARRGTSDPSEMLAQVSAVSMGRWSFAETEESDGKRHYAVSDNAPEPCCTFERLTERERNALLLLGRGYSLKLIACELGISTSQSFRLLESARRKLNLKHRVELIRAARTLRPQGSNAC